MQLRRRGGGGVPSDERPYRRASCAIACALLVVGRRAPSPSRPWHRCRRRLGGCCSRGRRWLWASDAAAAACAATEPDAGACATCSSTIRRSRWRRSRRSPSARCSRSARAARSATSRRWSAHRAGRSARKATGRPATSRHEGQPTSPTPRYVEDARLQRPGRAGEDAGGDQPHVRRAGGSRVRCTPRVGMPGDRGAGGHCPRLRVTGPGARTEPSRLSVGSARLVPARERRRRAGRVAARARCSRTTALDLDHLPRQGLREVDPAPTRDDQSTDLDREAMIGSGPSDLRGLGLVATRGAVDLRGRPAGGRRDRSPTPADAATRGGRRVRRAIGSEPASDAAAAFDVARSASRRPAAAIRAASTPSSGARPGRRPRGST